MDLPICAQYIFLAFTSQSRGHRGMRQIFIFVHMGWWNIMQARMLHRWTLIIGESNQFFCSTEIIQPNKVIIA